MEYLLTVVCVGKKLIQLFDAIDYSIILVKSRAGKMIRVLEYCLT